MKGKPIATSPRVKDTRQGSDEKCQAAAAKVSKTL